MSERKIKSVHLTNYYHKHSGGISTSYNHLLAAAERHRRHVRLIVPGERTETEDIGEYAKIYYVKANYSPVFDKRYRLMMPWNTYLLDKSPIKQILRDEKPDLIEIGEKYTLSLMAGLLRRGILNVTTRRPVLVHFSCERMDDNVSVFVSRGRLIKKLAQNFIGSYVIPMFDFHVANSDYTAAEFRDAVAEVKAGPITDRFRRICWSLLRAPKVPLEERIFVNQCGVDSETFSVSRRSPEARKAIESRYGLPEGERLLLYAGRLSPEKNVGLLAETMKELESGSGNDFRLLVAGGGPSSAWLEKNISNRRSTMLGHITDKDELADLFANCDVFVHPNPREPFGITPLEAMASGIPVVAPNSGGLLSYASDENAWLTEPNSRAFATAIRSVFEDEDLRTARIASGPETAAKFTWEASTDALFDLYDAIYAEFSGRRELYDHKG